ncbi:10052_t:CDS:2, partial [Diversispora eburnea]
EGNFTYAIDRRNGNPVLFCNPCGEDGKKFGEKKITEEEFRESSPETISCCQLVEWFNELGEEKKELQKSSLLVILNSLEEKGKLCPSCLEFRNNLQDKKLNNG